MAHCPDYSSDEGDSDDGDYYEFKQRIKATHTVQISEKERQIQSVSTSLQNSNLDLLISELDKGFNINEALHLGWNAILLAASYGSANIVRELLSRGADINSKKDGLSILMLASNVPETTRKFNETVQVLELFLQYGADPKEKNNKRMTPLMYAAYIGNLGAVKLLLPLSDAKAEDNQRWTALFWAVSSNHLDVVTYLLDKEFDYKKVDVRGNTVIDIAKFNEFSKILDLFENEEPDDTIEILMKHANSLNWNIIQADERPSFFLDIYSILQGVRCDKVLVELSNHNVGLLQFLSVNNNILVEMGIKVPYVRNRILNGLYKFHKHPFNANSLHVVQKNDRYSNQDVAIQIASAIKQITVMEASLKFIMNNFVETSDVKEIKKEIAKNLPVIIKRVEFMNSISNKLLKKAKEWDQKVVPPDLIVASSKNYRWPWRKLICSTSFACVLLLVIVKYK